MTYFDQLRYYVGPISPEKKLSYGLALYKRVHGMKVAYTMFNKEYRNPKHVDSYAFILPIE